ncbi:unnamed protein product [Amoebophrya sp. A25]|nr:unnamed protein product [Amoebophrya sp. A25]|eukprot:GSA25T00002617001.1
MTFAASMGGTAGKQLIRAGALLERRAPARGRIASVSGLVLTTVVGPVLDLGAYMFAPQSMVAPFSGLDVVWNAMLAPFTLGEKVTTPKAVAIGMVFSGVFSTLFFVRHEEPDYTADYMRELVVSWRAFIYLLCLLAFLGWNILWVQRKYKSGDNRRGLSLGVTGGFLAGTMFCVKLVGEIIQDCANASEGFGDRLAGLVFGAIFFSVMNIRFMALGMREFEVLFMVTIYEGSIVVSGCLCGTSIMRDFDSAEWFRPVGFYICVFIIVAGLYLLFIAQMQATSSLFNKTASIVLPSSSPLRRAGSKRTRGGSAGSKSKLGTPTIAVEKITLDKLLPDLTTSARPLVDPSTCDHTDASSGGRVEASTEASTTRAIADALTSSEHEGVIWARRHEDDLRALENKLHPLYHAVDVDGNHNNAAAMTSSVDGSGSGFDNSTGDGYTSTSADHSGSDPRPHEMKTSCPSPPSVVGEATRKRESTSSSSSSSSQQGEGDREHHVIEVNDGPTTATTTTIIRNKLDLLVQPPGTKKVVGAGEDEAGCGAYDMLFPTRTCSGDGDQRGDGDALDEIVLSDLASGDDQANNQEDSMSEQQEGAGSNSSSWWILENFRAPSPIKVMQYPFALHTPHTPSERPSLGDWKLN